MRSLTAVAPGAINLVFAVGRVFPVVGVAVLFFVPAAAAATAVAVTGVAIVPHSVGLGFVFGDLVLFAPLREMACT